MRDIWAPNISEKSASIFQKANQGKARTSPKALYESAFAQIGHEEYQKLPTAEVYYLPRPRTKPRDG